MYNPFQFNPFPKWTETRRLKAQNRNDYLKEALDSLRFIEQELVRIIWFLNYGGAQYASRMVINFTGVSAHTVNPKGQAVCAGDIHMGNHKLGEALMFLPTLSHRLRQELKTATRFAEIETIISAVDRSSARFMLGFNPNISQSVDILTITKDAPVLYNKIVPLVNFLHEEIT